MGRSRTGSTAGKGVEHRKEPSDCCVCGKCKENHVTADDQFLLCSICNCSLLADCLGMGDETYKFLQKCSCCLIVCELCRSEGVLASDRLTKVEDKVDKLAELICPMMTDDGEDDSPFAATEEATGSSNSHQVAQLKRSYAQMAVVGLPKSNLAKIVAHTVRQTLNQNQREDKEKMDCYRHQFASVERRQRFGWRCGSVFIH